MACGDLQQQCHELLRTLKSNQRKLRQGLGPLTDLTSLENNMQDKHNECKPEYAHQKLKSIMKHRNGESLKAADGNSASRSALGSPKIDRDLGYSELAGSQSLLSERSQERSLGKEKQQSDGRSRLVQGEREERSAAQRTHSGDTSRSEQVPGKTDAQDKGKENKGLTDHDIMQEYFQSRMTDSLMEDGTNSVTGVISTDDYTQPQPVTNSATPITVRRRRIIDKNVHVDSEVLSDAELRELERDTRGLNFSYSQNADDTLLKSKSEETDYNQNASSAAPSSTVPVEDMGFTYTKRLVDSGNSRQLNNFIKEATIKPKTILNSTQTFSTRGAPGASFRSDASTSGNSSLFRGQTKERRLLGYDWIAALIENNQGLMDESESYFHELREFRRCNRDECCNDFYMEGPFTLTQTEPPEVDKAIKETKVQPYTVNERLFTTPVTENLLGEPLDPDAKNKKQEEPSRESPRFVSVSIPRSTLLAPFRARPHRRRSFDASDSCSLTDHCLLGWNAVSPATLPTASSVALSDAVSGTNPRHATTMAEAERVAQTFQWPLLTDPRPKADSLPTWRRELLDTTNNFPMPDMSLSLSSSLGGRSRLRPSTTRSKTDELLNTTYSMMYEMQRAKEKREDERRRKVGTATS